MDSNSSFNLSAREDANVTNSATTSTTYEILHIAFQVCVLAVQVVIMLSMGTIISVKDIIHHLKRPISVVIAMTSQFFAMPACAYGVINLLQVSPAVSLTAMILACCPGGSSSNLFTYFCDGDVPLSIMLTTISTILALGFMPLNLWLYTGKWTQTEHLKIPYVGIATTLAWILIPLIFGMIIKKLLPKTAPVINKLGSVIGMLLIWSTIILQGVLHPDSYSSSWRQWLIAGLIPTAGFLAGLIMSLISRRPPKHRKTIAIETGMQSISLAVTIVLTSFPKSMHHDMTPIPAMCGVYLNGAGLLLATFIRIRNRFHRKSIEITTESKEQIVSTIS